jgi:hypothetical protein
MQYDATTDAAIARRNMHGWRIWTPSDLAYVCVDVFRDGWLEEQHVHRPGDESYGFWRQILENDTPGYIPWNW